jgi:hypothetical protein
MVDTVGSFTNVASVSIIIFVVSVRVRIRGGVIVIRVHAFLVIGLGGAKRTLASVIGTIVIIANRWVVEWTCTMWSRTMAANILAASHRI